MNALAAIAPTPTGLIAGGLFPAASRSPRGSSAPNPSSTAKALVPSLASNSADAANAALPSGFVNLINALLDSAARDDDSQQAAQPDDDDANGTDARDEGAAHNATVPGTQVGSTTSIVSNGPGVSNSPIVSRRTSASGTQLVPGARIFSGANIMNALLGSGNHFSSGASAPKYDLTPLDVNGSGAESVDNAQRPRIASGLVARTAWHLASHVAAASGAAADSGVAATASVTGIAAAAGLAIVSGAGDGSANDTQTLSRFFSPAIGGATDITVPLRFGIPDPGNANGRKDLARGETGSADDTRAESQVASQAIGQTAVPVASSAIIAGALIRSMLGIGYVSPDEAALSSGSESAGVPAASQKSGAPKSSAQRSATQKSTEKPQVDVFRGQDQAPMALAFPFAVPIESSSERATGDSALSGATSDASGLSSKTGPQIAASIDLARSPASQAPLAFSARLTPPVENQSAGNQSGSESQPDVKDSSLALPVAGNNQQDLDQQSRNRQTALSAAAARTEVPADSGENAVPRTAAVASPGDLARAFENTAQPGNPDQQLNPAKSSSTFGTVADAFRDSESRAGEASNVTAAAGSGASPVQEIAMRIARPELPDVDLRVTERAGEIHVAVRTPDTGLESALRQDLGTLTGSLERAGYRAETFVPRDGAAASVNGASPAGPFSNMNSRDDRHPEDRQQQSGSSGRQSGDSGQSRQQPRQRDSRAQQWIYEMEQQQ